MPELEQRIEALRQLLHGETSTPAPVHEAQAGQHAHVNEGGASPEMFAGHRPAHAAPGPLLDELQTPESVVNLHELRSAHGHQPAHSAERNEASGVEGGEVIRLQA